MKRIIFKNVNVAEKSPFTSKNTIKVVCKFATVVAIAILVAITTNNALLAQPPDPPPDCPGTPFMGPKKVKLKIGDCEFTYTYWWRYACGVWYDSYIENVELTNGDDSKCKEIFDTQYKTIYDAVTADIVSIQAPWGKAPQVGLEGQYPPPYKIPYCEDGESQPQWRFFRPSCQTKESVPHWDSEIGNVVMGRMRCPSKGYCYKTYTFCWKEEGGKTVLKETQTGGGTFGNIDCEPIINNDCFECVPTCD